MKGRNKPPCAAEEAARLARRVAELEACLQARESEASGMMALADLGELAAPMAHHVNNFLNNVLLDIAVLEKQPTESHKESIDEIRRQGRALALVVRRWQQYRGSSDEPDWRTDLGQAVRRAVQSLADRPGRLGPILPQFPGDRARESGKAVRVEVRESAEVALAFPAAELERLARFLIANAIAVSPPGSTVTVQLGIEEGQGLLIVADSGPSMAVERMPDLFDPGVAAREETNPLELAACQGMIRRRGGTLTPETQPEGGLVFRALLPVARSSGAE